MSESENWPAPDPIDAARASSQESWSDGGSYPKATFGQRLVGRLLDTLNIFALYLGYVMLTAVLLTAIGADDGDTITGILGGGGALGFVVLQVFWEGRGGTPFRRGYGAVIVDMRTGRPIGPARAFLRIVVANISLVVFGLGYLWMLWDPKRQTWHDKAARTFVIKK